jgi:hypothetical protein
MRSPAPLTRLLDAGAFEGVAMLCDPHDSVDFDYTDGSKTRRGHHFFGGLQLSDSTRAAVLLLNGFVPLDQTRTRDARGTARRHHDGRER